MFNEARLGRAVDVSACLTLVNDISESVHRNPGALVSLARLKTQDDYSYMHSVAVCALMVALGRQLGLDEDECREAGMAGLLHDIGKAVIPTTVLNKPGKLDDGEFEIIKTHPVRGHELLKAGGNASDAALDVCLHHHEKFDGSGYPHRLAGEAIHLLARMGAVCDVYDAITSDRPYKAGWDPAESVSRMAQWSGHFDPAVFKAFVASVGIYPVGSLVVLESKRVAVVVEQRAGALTKPVVKAFFSQRSKMPIPPVVIDLSAPGCSDRISARQDTTDWNEREVAIRWAGEAVPKGFKAANRQAGNRR
jgi:HD-GYP domain-containing protein (c-di-GMP phosphodiesterase class II)